MPNDMVAQVHVTLAPSVQITVEAMTEFSEVLRETGANDCIIDAWLACTERIVKAISPVPAGAQKANWN